MALRGDRTFPGVGWPTHLPGLMAPGIAAFATVYIERGKAGVFELASRCTKWRSSQRAYAFVGVFLILAVLPVITRVASMADLAKYSGAPATGVWVVLIVLFVNGYGEEVGWRGYLANRLLDENSLISTATITWSIWGLWHFPLFFVVNSYREFGIGGIIGWTVGLWFGSVFLVWLYKFSDRSIWVVVLWHVAYNFGVATDAARGIYPAIVTVIVILTVVVVMRNARVSVDMPKIETREHG